MEIRIKLPKKLSRFVLARFGTVRRFVKEFVIASLIALMKQSADEARQKNQLQQTEKGIIINKENPKKNKVFG